MHGNGEIPYNNQQWTQATSQKMYKTVMHQDTTTCTVKASNRSYSLTSTVTILDWASMKRMYALLIGLTWEEDCPILPPKCTCTKSLTVLLYHYRIYNKCLSISAYKLGISFSSFECNHKYLITQFHLYFHSQCSPVLYSI